MQGRRGSSQDWRRRQRAAPQPDRSGGVGAKPMDFLRRSVPGQNTGAMKGTLNMGSFNTQPNFSMAPTTPSPGGFQPFKPFAPQPRGTGDAIPDIGQAPRLGNMNIKTPYQQGPQNRPRVEPSPTKARKTHAEFFIGKGIPLTPEFEQGLRQVEDAFAKTMFDLGIQRAEVEGMIEQAKARTMTDFEQAIGAEEEGLAARGVGGGVAAQAQGDLNTQVTRTLQDQYNQGAGAMGQLNSIEADARSGRFNAIQELLLERARAAASSGDRGVSRRANQVHDRRERRRARTT